MRRGPDHRPISRLLPWALGSLLERPGYFRDLTQMYLQLWLDGLRRSGGSYKPVDWDTAMLELEDHYSGIREISEERSLANIHSEVARRSGELGQGGPWGIGLNGDFTLARCLYIICRPTESALHSSWRPLVEMGPERCRA
jgi:hypothetical protein